MSSSSYASGAHINPAVTLGLAANILGKGGTEFVAGHPGRRRCRSPPTSAPSSSARSSAPSSCWLAYKQHFDEEPEPALKLGVFSTGPAIRSYAWNLVTEIIGTFVLVFVVIGFGRRGDPDTSSPRARTARRAARGPPGVGIGASLGGPTGYAINPARDLGPRIAHAFLPIKGKGGSDWAYSWVPVVGPIIGGVLAGLAAIPLG